jgi:hypothetical protein
MTKIKLTKIIHSTLLVEYKGQNILFDPGSYSIEQIKDIALPIDILVITHSHNDHLHIESIKLLRQTNQKMIIITNSEVANILAENNILDIEICDKGDSKVFKNIKFQSYDFSHVEIFKDIVALPQNTAYLLDDVFYNPADSFGIIDIKPLLTVFMIAGPPVKIADSLNFATTQKMKYCVGVHDGMLKDMNTGSHKLPANLLKDYCHYQNLSVGESIEV